MHSDRIFLWKKFFFLGKNTFDYKFIFQANRKLTVKAFIKYEFSSNPECFVSLEAGQASRKKHEKIKKDCRR
ncbi:hypothetical protein NPIL_565531 [Nephila pilipes]|uniref:Uncharacterized protein n=1 Tax=Nephila pilipes TaxID=299642 RepID=A0A8X6NK84_NEPPI|nr:hypothetical protein NPIL_565531 [Nephila pilipes]